MNSKYHRPRNRVACLVALLVSGASAYAGDQTGRITSLYVRASDGLISVSLDGTHNGKPPCATNNYWMIKSEGTVSGKQQYATLLAARLSGRAVRIAGSNQCTRWGDGEDIDVVWVLD